MYPACTPDTIQCPKVIKDINTSHWKLKMDCTNAQGLTVYQHLNTEQKGSSPTSCNEPYCT